MHIANSSSVHCVHSRCSFLFLAVAVLTATGCNDNKLGRLPVSGRVTFEGQPLDLGTIDFRPPPGTGGVGSGAAIRGGQYAIEAKRGLPPGKYEVRIFSSKDDTSPLPEGVEPGGMRPAIERLPPRFNVETELEITVQTGAENKFDFDIPSK
jgi:hypothetical protein